MLTPCTVVLAAVRREKKRDRGDPKLSQGVYGSCCVREKPETPKEREN